MAFVQCLIGFYSLPFTLKSTLLSNKFLLLITMFGKIKEAHDFLKKYYLNPLNDSDEA